VNPTTGPNLAREPFGNSRPVRRLSALLWVLAIGLAAWNIQAYFASGAGATARRHELERLRSENAESRRRIDTLEADLRRADLERVNLQTEYLNQRIAERAFSWNLLFDDLVAVMPRQVRVQRLAPEGFRDERAGRTGRAPLSAERRVSLRISGEAADDESLLEFVDRLFEHPAFDAPNLSSESRTRAGGLDFEMTVGYLPAGSGFGALDGAASTPGGGAVAVPAAAGSATAPPSSVVERATAGGAGIPASTAAPNASGAPPSAAGGDSAGVRPRASAAAPVGRPAPSPGREGAAERVAASPAEPSAERAAPAPSPTPALSIFGVPLGAKPYASGGLQ